MSRPHLLLVDDSEAILLFERAALSDLYLLSEAKNGLDALEKAHTILPAAILLDLSMPGISGEDVLSRVKAAPSLREIPVVIISSEPERAQACLRKGAEAYLSKPMSPEELRAVVSRVLDEASRRKRHGGFYLLPVGVGPLTFGIPLSSVREVVLQPETTPLLLEVSYLRESFNLGGEPICILDTARWLGVKYQEPIEERKLVVLEGDGPPLALSVDWVEDPEELLPKDLIDASVLSDKNKALRKVLRVVARRGPNFLPVIETSALLSPRLLRMLPGAIKTASEGL
jgi:CheY-like chemotaxis protein/chemotaxis signal transduction protein